MKYELTNETHPDHPTLYRIRALRDIPERGVKSGDLGGWVESEGNLSHECAAWVSGDARVFGTAQVSGNARVYGDASVYGHARVADNASVYGNARVYGGARVYGDASVYGNDAQVYGGAWVHGDARVFGDAQVYVARHVTTLGPVGSEDRVVTIYRDKDGTARIVAGCWTGTPDELAERIKGAWPGASKPERQAWKADYKTVIKLARRREKEWNK